jgi:cell division cycle 2-like protein
MSASKLTVPFGAHNPERGVICTFAHAGSSENDLKKRKRASRQRRDAEEGQLDENREQQEAPLEKQERTSKRSRWDDFDDADGDASNSDSEDGNVTTATAATAVSREFSCNKYRRSKSGNQLDRFKNWRNLGRGTFGAVFRVQDRISGLRFALKKFVMKGMPAAKGGDIPLHILREFNILMALEHECILRAFELVVSPSDSQVFMVTESMDGDLRSVMDTSGPFDYYQVRSLMRQLLEAVQFMHKQKYMHRDLKTSNILYNRNGKLRVGDFGSARRYGETGGNRTYTLPICTPCSRAPELFLGERAYATEIDIWSVGCIFAELLTSEFLFAGSSERSYRNAIFAFLGAPTDESWPEWRKLPGAGEVYAMRSRFPRRSLLRSQFPVVSWGGLRVDGQELLEKLLAANPQKRIAADKALQHHFFTKTVK